MKKYANVEEIREKAIEVAEGMQVYWPQEHVTERLALGEIPFKSERKFDMNNGILSFVLDGRVYVIPEMWGAYETLQSERFLKESFYVPFSNADYPVAYKAQWKALLEEQRKSQREEFLEECRSFCQKNGIGSIDSKLVAMCLEIPGSGLAMHHLYGDTFAYPVLSSQCFDSVACSWMGTYATNNGTCQFVYCDGKTYVTRNWDVVDALKAAGYKRKERFVPLSNGEVPTDPGYKNLWLCM